MRATTGRNYPTVDATMRQAALACIGKLKSFRRLEDTPESPSGAVWRIAHALGGDDMADQVWIVDGGAPPGGASHMDSEPRVRRAALPSAIATWFRSAADAGRPLLYLLHSPTLRGVLAAEVEAQGVRGARDVGEVEEPGDAVSTGRVGSAGRGIFLNDATLTSPDRLRRVRPELPLWLAAQAQWLPYDPASAEELQALLCAALDALYVKGESGFCYLSAHDVASSGASPLSPSDASDAYRGMYRLRALPQTNPPYAIRLCGAGRALGNVLEAARWLQLDWGVACEVWSCPSYTRLAREAAQAERMSLLGGEMATDSSTDSLADPPHITRCLGTGRAPVLAVTGYARHIANQIGAFVPASFAALGSDGSEGHDIGGDGRASCDVPGVRWIVLNALRLLVIEGTLPGTRLVDATRRYGIV